MKLRLVAPATLLSALLFLPQAQANHSVVGGGDAVNCSASADNSFDGLYSLDYLLTYRVSNQNADIVPANSWEASFARLHNIFQEKVPELLPTFEDFTHYVRNTNDHSKPRVWEEAPFGLIPIDDQAIVSLTPENCRDGDKINIVQAVARQPPESSGSPAVIYKFVPSVFDQLEATSPIQLSFLLVHEWLWDLSDNVDRNRRISRFLHSNVLETMSGDEIRAQLRGMGLELPGPFPGSGDDQLVSSAAATCYLHAHQLNCWGSLDHYASAPAHGPSVVNPRAVAVGRGHICALGDNGVKCIGDQEADQEGATTPVSLHNPQAIAAGDGFSCAVDDFGVSCWGALTTGPSDVGADAKITGIYARDDWACVTIKDGQPKCWGSSSTPAGPKIPMPTYSQLRLFSLGVYHACGLDGDTVKCFGWNDNGQAAAPALSHVRSVSAGYVHSCAIDNTGVYCWGYNDNGQRNVPDLKNPKLVSTGNDFTCALDERGITCWGNDDYHQLNVPDELRPH